MTNSALLRTDDLTKVFTPSRSLKDRILGNERNPIRAVDDVSLSVDENEVLGVIGESGCGKTTLLRTIAGLYSPTDGAVHFRGEDIAEFSKQELREFRRSTSIIFQEPFNALNPKLTVADTVKEPLTIHGMDDKQRRVREALVSANLSPPDRFLDKRPDQLSGGEKQRVAIARAIVTEPDLILADEPVSMLDVSIQASILKLLDDISDEYGMSILYISHDLSTVSYLCDDVGVMYLGRIVEQAPTATVINDPKHPYTRELIASIPVPDPNANRERTSLPGVPEDPTELLGGCRFRDRCPDRMDVCEQVPPMLDVGDAHEAACHLYDDHQLEGLTHE